MRMPRFCDTHPTYQAKRPPTSGCPRCYRAYRRERRKFDIVCNAAEALSKLLSVPVTLEAKYRRPGLDDAGMKVEVVQL